MNPVLLIQKSTWPIIINMQIKINTFPYRSVLKHHKLRQILPYYGKYWDSIPKKYMHNFSD